MNREQLMQQYAAQNKPQGKAGNVYYRGRVLFSYGEHFPLAYVRGTRAFFNCDKYSISTSRQQSTARSVLQRAGFLITETTTQELREIISAEMQNQNRSRECAE